METKHIIPVGGPEPLHVASGSCWCHPAPDTEAPGILIHNAKDCREKWERQGLRPENDSAWVTIIEATQAPIEPEIRTSDHPELLDQPAAHQPPDATVEPGLENDDDEPGWEDDDEPFCFTCQNTGYVNCYCGGDFCVCDNHGERDCPNCDRGW